MGLDFQLCLQGNGVQCTKLWASVGSHKLGQGSGVMNDNVWYQNRTQENDVWSPHDGVVGKTEMWT